MLAPTAAVLLDRVVVRELFVPVEEEEVVAVVVVMELENKAFCATFRFLVCLRRVEDASLIGAFEHACIIVIFTEFLRTLDETKIYRYGINGAKRMQIKRKFEE